MASGNIPPQRREVVALWRDEMSDEKHEKTHRLCSCFIEKNPTVFEPSYFFPKY